MKVNLAESKCPKKMTARSFLACFFLRARWLMISSVLCFLCFTLTIDVWWEREICCCCFHSCCFVCFYAILFGFRTVSGLFRIEFLRRCCSIRVCNSAVIYKKKNRFRVCCSSFDIKPYGRILFSDHASVLRVEWERKKKMKRKKKRRTKRTKET